MGTVILHAHHLQVHVANYEHVPAADGDAPRAAKAPAHEGGAAAGQEPDTHSHAPVSGEAGPAMPQTAPAAADSGVHEGCAAASQRPAHWPDFPARTTRMVMR